MTVVTLRPDGTSSNTGTLVGATTAHGALSDNGDGSYLRLAVGQSATLSLADFALPAGAVVKHVSLRVRGSGGGSVEAVVSVSDAGPKAGGTADLPLSLTTLTVGSAVTGWTAAQINTATLKLAPAHDGSADVLIYEAYFDVTYVAKPVTTVTAPANTETVTWTNMPTVAWSNTLDADGGGQAAREVKIFTIAQFGAAGFTPNDPPTVGVGPEESTATQWSSPTTLPDGTYRSYARAAQRVNGALHWADWSFTEWTISVSLPAVPSIYLTPEPSSGRIVIGVNGNAGPATTDALELQRLIDGAWVGVRNTSTDYGFMPGTASAGIHDHEVPNGGAATYRARALHNYSGQYAASAWIEATATWSADQWWLKDVIEPSRNLPVELFSYTGVQRPARQGVFQALGASRPLVVSDTRGGEAGTVVVQCRTVEEQEALETFVLTVGTAFLQGPVDHGEPDRFVVFGDMSTERIVDKGRFPMKRSTLAWTQVDTPAGAQGGARYVGPGTSSNEELVVA